MISGCIVVMCAGGECRDVVITILSDEAQGVEAMEVCVEKPGLCRDTEERGTVPEITTPMRMLIEEMPGEVRSMKFSYRA